MKFIITGLKALVLLIVLGMTLLMCGCAKHVDPVTDINNDIQQGVAELVDYANNNMVMDADTKLLVDGARACASKANALTHQHEAQIKTCNANTDKAVAERNMLALILILLVCIKLFNIRL